MAIAPICWCAVGASVTLRQVRSASPQSQRTEILRYAAFTHEGRGGNPAGVVLDAAHLSAAQMQRIAREVGYSETAFLSDGPTPQEKVVRYFSPEDEVAFCGHATVAAAVAYAERTGEVGDLVLHTPAGVVGVRTSRVGDAVTATLTSLGTSVRPVPETQLAETLAALRWRPQDLDDAWPPMVANAGNDHLILVVRTRDLLGSLDYDYPRLASLMRDTGWTTVHLTWPESERFFHARDPFPPGGVVEDPATGAAAAAFGAYLRCLDRVPPDRVVEIRQGEDMGRPSRLRVSIPTGKDSGVLVSGTAAPMG